MKTHTQMSLGLISLLTLLLMLPCRASWAADDFLVELPVADDSRAGQDAAFAEGMRIVLGRLSGEATLWARAPYGDLVDTAAAYILKFNYRRMPAGDARRLMRIWYRQDALTAALRQRGFRFASDNPLVLLWLLEQHGGESWLLAPGEPDSLYRGVVEMGRAQGVSLLLPLVDLQERAAFNGLLSEAQADAALVSLSQRYEPDVVLIGRLRRQTQDWQLDWTRIQGGRQQRWRDSAMTLDRLLQQGMQQLASGGPGGSPDEADGVTRGTLELAVTQVGGGGDVARLTDYLQGLSLVEQVRNQGRKAGWLHLELRVLGSAAELEQSMRFGGVLKPVEAPKPERKPRPQVFDPLADIGLPGRSSGASAKPARSAPAPLYFRLVP
jgi:hypothetical protein